MERIKVYKGKEWLAKFFVYFGVAYTIFGLALFINYFAGADLQSVPLTD